MRNRRKRPYRQRIRTKLIIAFVTPVAIIELVFALFFYVLAKDSLDQEMGRRIAAIAQAAATQIPPERILTLGPGDEETSGYQRLVERMALLARENQVARVYVFDEFDRSLADSTGMAPIGSRYNKLASDRLELERVRGGQTASSTLFTGPDGLLYKSGYAPLRHEASVIAVVGVDASADFFNALRSIRSNLVLLGAATVLGIVLISLLFARRIEQPIERLVGHARRIADGDLDTPIDVVARDEVGFLARTMEEMRKGIVDQTSNLKMLQRGIAHEVRNPLGGMELFTGLLMEEIEDEGQRDYVRKIRKELQSLTRVVNSFLEYTREINLEPRAVALAPFVHEIVDLLAEEIASRGIRVELGVGNTLPPVDVDPDLMQGVFMNILTNACQAMPDGGVLAVEAERDAAHVRVSISDTGSGIDEKNLASLFEPFFTTKEKGSGLGLAFAKKICELHGGTIEAANRDGGGAVFTLSLPVFRGDR